MAKPAIWMVHMQYLARTGCIQYTNGSDTNMNPWLDTVVNDVYYLKQSLTLHSTQGLHGTELLRSSKWLEFGLFLLDFSSGQTPLCQSSMVQPDKGSRLGVWTP
jgi:hypothetical protein